MMLSWWSQRRSGSTGAVTTASVGTASTAGSSGAAGTTTASIDVAIVNDGAQEATEYIDVRMGASVNAAKGFRTRQRVTIKDNDPFVKLQASKRNLTELDLSLARSESLPF